MARTTGLFRKRHVNRSETIVVTENGNGRYDEGYNRLKDNLIYYSNDGKHRVIQIESSIAGEGKTTLACNLAVSLAKNDKKVVIVDLDFRKPRTHRAFKISKENGIGDFLSGDLSVSEIVKHTEYGVDIITGGKAIYNSSLVLTSGKMSDLITALRQVYDFVLLDCPPVLLISDYINIARYSDGIIFVVAAGYTKKSAVIEAHELIKKTDSPVIGAVMTFTESASGYYGYYRYKYGYGKSYTYGESQDNQK